MATSVGLRAGTANDGYIQVNGVDKIKVDSTGLTTFLVPPITTAPILSVYRNATQSLAHAATTKILMDTVIADTANYWSTVNARYTPLTSGWYQVNWRLGIAGTSITDTTAILLKNGAAIATGGEVTGVNLAFLGSGGSYLVSMNGSTDYLELAAYFQTSGATAGTLNAGAATSYMTIAWIRSL